MFEEQEDQDRKNAKPTDWTGVVIGTLLLPVGFFFDHLGKGNIGLNVCVCLGGILLAIKTRWYLRSHLWFWGTIAFVAVLNVPLVLLIRWPQGWVPAAALLPLALGEFLITVETVRLAEKFFAKASY